MTQEPAFIRIGVDNTCYRFETNCQDEFIAWHSTTEWFQKQDELAPKKRKIIRWGKKRNALGWQHFDEGALLSDGSPKAVCMRCHKVIKHPTINGTTGMDAHLATKDCQNTARSRGLHQLSIMEGFRAGVLP